jgi:hypothetical protein
MEELESLDPDARVLFASDYGDYHHTQQALPVGQVDEHLTSDLAESAYSHSRVALVADEPDEHDEPRAETDDEPEDVVVLSGSTWA